MKTNKISIIGAGNVGAATAYTLMLQKIASDIVLVDINHERALGEAMDIGHGTSLIAPVEITAGTIKDTKDSDIVIISAGVAQKPGETRLDLVNNNIKLYSKLIPEVVRYNPNSILLVVSNPVDILTYITYKISGFPKERVIGSGTVLDTSRLRSALAREFSIDARNVHSYVMGEHGDSEVIGWSKTNIGGLSFSEFYQRTNIKEKADSFKERIADEVKNAAYEIISRKGYTNYAVAVAVARICTAILRDERSILTTSSYLDGMYGINDVYLATPSILGRDGLVEMLEMPLEASELKRLKESANILKDIIKASDL